MSNVIPFGRPKNKESRAKSFSKSRSMPASPVERTVERTVDKTDKRTGKKTGAGAKSSYDEEPLFSLSVYRDQKNVGEVVARFNNGGNLSRIHIANHLDEISWKAKNMEARNGHENGRVALIITQYENAIEFVENTSVEKDADYIENLKLQFNDIIQCLISEMEGKSP